MKNDNYITGQDARDRMFKGVQKELQFENLLLQARIDVQNNYLYGPKVMFLSVGGTEAIQKAYEPALRYLVDSGNEFLAKILNKNEKK